MKKNDLKVELICFAKKKNVRALEISLIFCLAIIRQHLI